LHQGSSIKLDAAPSMTYTMLAGLVVMTLACWAYSFAVTFARARYLIDERAALEAQA